MTDSSLENSEANNKPVSTRERLVHAARDLFNSDGYLATDTNKIARAAGFAPATFYKHFRDKRDVFIEVYRAWVIAEWSMLRSPEPKEGDAETLTRQRLRLIRDHHCRWAGFRRSLRALVSTEPEVQAVRLEQRRLQLTFLEDFRAAQGLPKMKRQQLLFILYTVERVCDAIADQEIDSLDVAEEDLFEELVQWLTEYNSGGANGQ